MDDITRDLMMPQASAGQATKPQRSLKLTLMLIILLSVISFITSYKGLVILNVENDSDLSLWKAVFVGFMVFTIQATLVITLLFMIHGYRTITRLLALIVYVVAMLFSVFFSYGWWYETFRAGSYAEEVYKDSLEEIRSDARTYQQSFAHVYEMAAELSMYSAKKARDENLYGGTCDEESLPGKGALNYLRNDEAERFGRMADDVKGLEEKVGTDIKALNELLDSLDLSGAAVSERERELNDIVMRIGSYKNGPVASNIRNKLEDLRGDKRIFLGSINPKDDERTVVSCLDAEITRKIDALLQALDQLPATSKVTLFDQSNNRTVLERSWEVFSAVLTFGVDDKADATEKASGIKLSTTDYVPLVAGLLIDLFILVLGLIDGLEYGRFYTGRRYSAEDAEQLSHFYARQDEDAGQFNILQPYLYSGWLSYYLIVPVKQGAQLEQEQQILRIMSWLEAHKKIDLYAQSIDLHYLPDVMQEFFTADTPANQWRQIWRFDVYRVRKSMWHELVIAHARHRPQSMEGAQA